MQRSEPENKVSQKLASLLSGAAMVLWMVGCGSGGTSSGTPTTPQQAPQTYLAPVASGVNYALIPQIYIFDDVAKVFSQEIFTLQPPTIIGSKILAAGSFTASTRGLETLTNNGLPGGFAVELPGQTGGLVQQLSQPVQPLVATTQCPNFTSAQHYQFISLPANEPNWEPSADTAYGSVDIDSSGTTVNFKNIDQYLLPSEGGAGTSPAHPGPTSQIGACGPTTLGQVTGIPGQYVVSAPGTGGSTVPIAPPQAAIGIGPTGLLVEDNGGTVTSDTYVLGAGTGAIGLPVPSNPVDTGTLIGEQYLGFINGAGQSTSLEFPVVPWTSHLASFGFPAGSQASCAAFAAQTGTLVNGIYGGDFTNDDPSTSPDGFGNCDFAIDLGIQGTNGLYPNATVWFGTGYGGYTGSTYSFPAVAIAGQLNDGTYAIFVIGADSAQPWAIYLLQSKLTQN